ncbi:MAG: EamA family transporter [bacterium]|nr:EamA family transporter [bacterium]
MDSKTLIYTALSILSFGFWGMLMQLGQKRLGPMPHLVAMGISIAALVALGLISRQVSLPPLKPALWISVGATVATMAALVFFTFALARAEGNTTAVVALTALYPGVTALLSVFFLGESFSLAKGAGLVLALGAAILFTL